MEYLTQSRSGAKKTNPCPPPISNAVMAQLAARQNVSRETITQFIPIVSRETIENGPANWEIKLFHVKHSDSEGQ